MAITVTDIIVTPARIFYAPVGEALPDETTIEYGDAWGGNWVDLGATSEPITWISDRTEFEAMIQQSTMVVKRRKVDEKFAFETVLAELTPTNLSILLGGTVATTAAGASQRGFQQLPVGGNFDITERIWGIEGLYEDASDLEFPIRIFMPKATANLNGNLQFGKANVAGIPLRVDAIADLSAAVGAQGPIFQRVTAETTA